MENFVKLKKIRDISGTDVAYEFLHVATAVLSGHAVGDQNDARGSRFSIRLDFAGSRPSLHPAMGLHAKRTGRCEYNHSWHVISPRRRVHLVTVLLRPPSAHRPDRRQARHAHIPQIGLRLAIAQAVARPAMPASFR